MPMRSHIEIHMVFCDPAYFFFFSYPNFNFEIKHWARKYLIPLKGYKIQETKFRFFRQKRKIVGLQNTGADSNLSPHRYSVDPGIWVHIGVLRPWQISNSSEIRIFFKKKFQKMLDIKISEKQDIDKILCCIRYRYEKYLHSICIVLFGL